MFFFLQSHKQFTNKLMGAQQWNYNIATEYRYAVFISAEEKKSENNFYWK